MERFGETRKRKEQDESDTLEQDLEFRLEDLQGENNER